MLFRLSNCNTSSRESSPAQVPLICSNCTYNHWQINGLLQRTQSHWGTRPVRPEPKPRIKRFSERGVGGVEVDQCVRGDSVEWQRAGRIVHIHRYSVWAGGGGGGGDVCGFVIVPHGVTDGIRADQTPRLIVPPKQALVSVSFPADSSVSHCYVDSAAPLHLPVTATSQIITAQQLRPVVKSVWMIGIWLILLHMGHHLVAVRQFDLLVQCVCVELEFAEIWWREQEAIQLQLLIHHLFIYLENDDGIRNLKEEQYVTKKRHLHFFSPGFNHSSPPGSILKEQAQNMKMTQKFVILYKRFQLLPNNPHP